MTKKQLQKVSVDRTIRKLMREPDKAKIHKIMTSTSTPHAKAVASRIWHLAIEDPLKYFRMAELILYGDE